MSEKIRRYDLDWIRVIVFDILIIYHVGMFFVPWDWHIKNDVIVEWMRYPMIFINQWRLPILFVVSGMGTRYAMSFRSGKTYLKERFLRLFIPLAVGILLVVPPQVYIERFVDGDFSGSFFQFYPHFFDGVYPDGNFSWHHLWFLPYLLIMSVLATPLFLNWRKPGSKLVNWYKNMLSKSPFYIYLVVVPLFFVEAFLEPIFPVTHALVGDWYALALFSLFFLFGFILIGTGQAFWKSVERIKYAAVVIGLICFPALLWFWFNVDSSVFIPTLKILNMWSWIIAIFGFSAKYLNKEGRVIKYRNQAVYPFYILHQTITIIIAYFLIDASLHYSIKFLILLVGTFAFTWLIYEFLIRRIKMIRPLFGVKNRPLSNKTQVNH